MMNYVCRGVGTKTVGRGVCCLKKVYQSFEQETTCLAPSYHIAYTFTDHIATDQKIGLCDYTSTVPRLDNL